MENLVICNGIGKHYREFTLGPLDLVVPAGRILGIIGPNGAGKTTTLKMLMNMVKPDDGRIEILGKHYPRDERAIKNAIGYVGEEQFFYEDRTVAWTGRFVSHFFTAWNENEFDQLLMRFGISRTKKVKTLSKGMRVKLALAVALSHRPQLIILDEPTSGLDPVIRRELLVILKERSLADENLSIIISSHITDDLERIADLVYYMINGRIVLADDKDTLLDEWKKLHFKAEKADEAMLAGLRNIERNLFGISGMTSQYNAFRAAHAEAIRAGDVRVENVRLDDILIALMER
ncbi:MAG: ABC transporter ATP-binding protein [Anaerolineae bacterium]|nr:ABC transporter ATP-binding protein [Anaerolineae bacterium]